MAAAPFKEAKIFTLLGQSFVEVRCFKNHFTVAEKKESCLMVQEERKKLQNLKSQ